MRNALFPRLSCPVCSGQVKRLRRKLGGWDFVWAFGGDLPFWVVFGLCGAIGMWAWSAGVVAFLATVYLLYVWDRRRSSYQCVACGATSGYAAVHPGRCMDSGHTKG